MHLNQLKKRRRANQPCVIPFEAGENCAGSCNEMTHIHFYSECVVKREEESGVTGEHFYLMMEKGERPAMMEIQALSCRNDGRVGRNATLDRSARFHTVHPHPF